MEIGHKNDLSGTFIFGGVGNKTGRQTDGFKRFYDLFYLDLNTFTLTRLWDLEEELFGDQDTYYQIILDETNNELYVFRHFQSEDGGTLQLFKTPINSPSFAPVADELFIPGYNEIPELFFDETLQEFFIIHLIGGKDSTAMTIYSLNYPPLPPMEPSQAAVVLSSEQGTNIWIWLSVFFLVGFSGIYFIKRKNKLDIKSMSFMRKIKTGTDRPREPSSRIRVFGTFQLMDKKGNDLSSLFTPQLKELFLLIFIHSHSTMNPSENGQGITLEKINSIFWPEGDPPHIKSSRTSAMGRLRKILNHHTGLKLIQGDHLWAFDNHDSVHCDLCEYTQAMAEIKHNSLGTTLNDLLLIVENGTMLTDLSYGWLDPIRTAMKEELIAAIERLVLQYDCKKNPELYKKSGEAILACDSINETGLRFNLIGLAKLGRHGNAKSVFDRFALDYQGIYGEKFDHSLKDFV
jgi:two-component SAPR family response regulator